MHKETREKVTSSSLTAETTSTEYQLAENIAMLLFLRQQRKELLAEKSYIASMVVTLAFFYLALDNPIFTYFTLPNIQTYALTQNEQLYNRLVNDIKAQFGRMEGWNSLQMVCRQLDSIAKQGKFPINLVPNQEVLYNWGERIKKDFLRLIANIVRTGINRRTLGNINFSSLERMYRTYNELLADSIYVHPPSNWARAAYNYFPSLMVEGFYYLSIPFMMTQLLRAPIHFGIKKAYITARNHYDRCFSNKENVLKRDPTKLTLPELKQARRELGNYNAELVQNIRDISLFFKILFPVLLLSFLFIYFIMRINILTSGMLSAFAVSLTSAINFDIRNHRNIKSIKLKLASLKQFLYDAIPIQVKINTEQGQSLETSQLTIIFESTDKFFRTAVANELSHYGIRLFQERSNYLICHGSSKKFTEVIAQKIHAAVTKELNYYAIKLLVDAQMQKIASAINKYYIFNPEYHDHYSYSFDLTGLPSEKVIAAFNHSAKEVVRYYEAPYLRIEVKGCLNKHNLPKLCTALSKIQEETYTYTTPPTNKSSSHLSSLATTPEAIITTNSASEKKPGKRRDERSTTISVISTPEHAPKLEIKWNSVKYSSEKKNKYLVPVINKPKNRFFFFNKHKFTRIPEDGVSQVFGKGQGLCLIGPQEATKAQRKYRLKYLPVGKYRFGDQDARIWLRREDALSGGGEVLYVAEDYVPHSHKH
jgi:hypothetical protein